MRHKQDITVEALQLITVILWIITAGGGFDALIQSGKLELILILSFALVFIRIGLTKRRVDELEEGIFWLKDNYEIRQSKGRSNKGHS